MVTSIAEAFFWGFFGSCALEIVMACNQLGPEYKLPKRFCSPTFIILRGLLTIASGFIASLYFMQNPDSPAWLYLHVGAATPAIVTRTASAVPPANDQAGE